MLRRPTSSLISSSVFRRYSVSSSSATHKNIASTFFSAASFCSSSQFVTSSRVFSSTPVRLDEQPQQQQQQQQQQESEKKFSLPSWTDPNSKNLYHRLGLKNDASVDEIKKHYRHLSRMYHPDLNKSEGAEQKFLNVKEAYETLSDAQKRNVYNSTGASWSQQEQYQRASGGGNPFGGGMYSSSFTWSNRAVNPQITRGLLLVVFFSFGLALSALMELRTRRNATIKMSDQQEELSKMRSSLWRPFIGMMLFISLLPRLPAAILCWYFYAYLPTIRAEDRSSKDPTVVVKDEQLGKGFHVKLWSPFLEALSRNAGSSGGRGLDHILVVSVQPDETKLTVQQQNELREALGRMSPEQVQKLMGATEYAAMAINIFEISAPKPHLYIKSLGGMVPVPCRVSLRVKTVVKDSNGKIAPERGELIYEKRVDI